MKNKKYIKKSNIKVKWLMFKTDVENFFKVLFRKRTKESKVARQTLNNILDKNNYLKIPEYLKEAGFTKLDENEKEPTAKDLEEGTTLAVANKSVHLAEIELVLYSDVNGFEDRYLITYIIIDYSSGIPKAYFQGIFCDQTHKTQKDRVELKKLIKRLTLATQRN